MRDKLKKFCAMPFVNKVNSLHRLWRLLIGVLYYRRVFASFGNGSVLFKPMLLSNTQFIHIGKNVLIREGARLETVMIDPANPPELRIGDNVTIEQDVHIVVLGKMTIGDDVSIAPRCTFNCGSHPFLNVHDPVKIGSRLAGVNYIIEVGEGALLGVGCVVQMNVRIGRYVVVGSSSVVKRNIPEYSIADGNPLVVGMRYDPEQNRWVTLGKTKEPTR